MLTAVLHVLLASSAAHADEPSDASPDASDQPSAVAPPPAPVDPLAALQGAHGADAPKRTRRDPQWDTWGNLRGRVIGGTDPALDDVGTRSGRTWWATSRLLAGADWRPTDRTTVEFELEAMNGQFAGQTTQVGTDYSDDVFRVRRADSRDLTVVVPRKLNVQLLFPEWGQLRLGAQTFTWGTGMLANDGAGDPDFGDANTGSIVARAAVIVTPWRYRETAVPQLRGLAFFVSGDVVIRDDNAELFEGDLAFAGVAGLRVTHPLWEAGALVVARAQRDRVDPYDPRDTRTQVRAFPVDVFGRVVLTRFTSHQRVLVEGEVVTVNGWTNRSYLDATVEDGARVASWGGLLRVRYDHDDLGVTAKVEAGFATGDNDVRDDVVRSFSFHTDHNVGMLLFDEVLPLVTARALDRAADPALLAVPSPAGRYTVNQGAVSNAVYVNPVLRYAPVTGLDLRLGWVAAWSAGDLVDVYQTGIGGGYPTTPGGVSGGSHTLGHEVDLGARYTVAIPGATALTFGAEGAVFAPGAAFDGVGGDRLDTQWLGRGRLDFTW